MADNQPAGAGQGSASAQTSNPPFLGHAQAAAIVSGCAGTSGSNLPRSLEQLGVNGIAFQKCVFNGVQNAGYNIGIDDIPDSPDTTLLAVVAAIQDAPRKA